MGKETEKDPRYDASPNDPRISLIFVKAHSIHYHLQTLSTPVVYFNILKGMVTGEPPKVGKMGELNPEQVQEARKVEE